MPARDVETMVRSIIAAQGPLPFSQVMELALYDPDHGFYATGGQAGRRGDFITSPEVGPLFGHVIANALDTWWREAGEPEHLTLVEGGAGPGTLARSILFAEPDCAKALRYILVERSERQRTLHASLLERYGDQIESRAAMPARGEVEGLVIVLANELLDNLPFHLMERTAVGWQEVCVGLRDDRLVEVLTDTELRDLCERFAPDAMPGQRIPLQIDAVTWLKEALELVKGGRVLIFDYAATTPELAERPWTEWLRTYRQHERGGHPLDGLGQQDITGDVAVDQLAAIRRPTVVATQSAWLAGHGVEQLVDQGRLQWNERAHLGDLEAVKARSRIVEAEALTDLAGLGRFASLEWVPGRSASG